MMRVLVSLLLLVCTVESTGYVPVYPPKLPQCECTHSGLSVIGYVFDGVANGPGVAGVPVVVGGNQLTTTDGQGFYRISVENTGRIPIRFEAGPPFTPVTKVLNIPDDYTGEVRFDVILVRGKVITIDATKANVLDIPLGRFIPNVTFEIAANNFKNAQTGRLVDRVLVTLTVWSTDDDDDATTVPGDFCTVDEDGNKQGLFSNGILCMTFTDEDRNEVEPQNGCVVLFPRNQFTNALGPPTLWDFDGRTGLWGNVTTFLENGDNLAAIVQPNTRFLDLNIDWRFDLCTLKVETYRNDFFIHQDAGVSIQITQRVSSIGAWVYSSAATTGRDGACIRVLCCKKGGYRSNCGGFGSLLRARITATKDGRKYFGANRFQNQFPSSLDDQLDYTLEDDDITIDTKTFESFNGPVYPSPDRCEAGDFRYSFYRVKLDLH